MLHFWTNGNRDKRSTELLYNLQLHRSLTVSSIAEMLSSVRDDRGRSLPAVRSIELFVRNFHKKSSKVSLFQFSLRNSLMSLRAEISFRLRMCGPKFYLQNSTYFISSYYYYARSNSM